MNLANGLVSVGAGVLALLYAGGKLPRHPKNPEKMKAWRQKYGGRVGLLGIIVILFGILEALGVAH